MRGKLSEVGAGLRVAGRELQRVLEIGAGVGGSSGAGLEHTQIVPAVGIGGLEVECLGLFFDCLLQVVRRSQDLGKKRMEICVTGGQRYGLTQLS
jgi:hypothetical protein